MTIEHADPTAQLGRFVVTDRPSVSPGCCVVCGYAGADRRYLDFRLDFEFYGSVYLCYECMVDAGNCLGMASTEQYQTALATITSLNEILEETREALRLSENTVDLLSQRRLSDRALDNSANVVVAASRTEQSESTDYRHAKKPVAAVTNTKREPAKSTDEQGPDDISDALGLD